jgi:hypothetical protein
MKRFLFTGAAAAALVMGSAGSASAAPSAASVTAHQAYNHHDADPRDIPCGIQCKQPPYDSSGDGLVQYALPVLGAIMLVMLF